MARLMAPASRPAPTSALPSADGAPAAADSMFPSAVLESKIRAVQEDFVETKTFREVERLLRDQGTAVVVGPTGEGKSVLGLMICSKLQREGYLCAMYESVDKVDTESIAKSDRNLCIVLDNVFGSSIVDTCNLDKWAQVLRDLISVQTTGGQGREQASREEESSRGKKSLLLLLLSRDNVFSEALDQASKLPSVLKNRASRISMKSDTLKEEDKKRLLKKYTGKAGQVLKEKDANAILNSSVPVGFPQICRLYYEMETVQAKPVELFSRPVAVLLETVREMMRKDAMVRAALALLVLQGGSVPLESIQLPDKREASGVSRTVQILQTELGGLGSEVEVYRQLPKTLKGLCRGLLREEEGRVSFSHDSVRDTVCVVLAQDSLPFVAQHCSLAVLSQCIHLADSSTSSFAKIHSESVLSVPSGQWALFTQRLVSEIEKGKFREVFTCGLLSHRGFCNLLAAECRGSSQFSKLVREKDGDCGLHFLFWASMAPSHFLMCLLQAGEFEQFERWELWQGMFGCCVKGHADLVKRMYESLPEKRAEDWCVPISCWLPKPQRGEGARTGPWSPRRCSPTECNWEDLPVGRHSIPGTVAAEHGHVSVLETLVGLGMPADVRDPEQCTPLMSACSCGKEEVVSFLVSSQEVDLTASDKAGSTPLHRLAEGGHGMKSSVLVEKLITNRQLCVCVNGVNVKLQTPLMLACRFSPSLAFVLLEKGAGVEKVDVEGKSCLHFTAEAGNPDLLKKLLESHSMDPNQAASSGWSPLHFACSSSRGQEAVPVLLKAGADAKLRHESTDVTPLHLAVRQGCIASVKALVESVSDVLATAESCPSDSPFLLACRNGNIDVVQYLHSKNADVHRKTEDDSTALHLAAESGSVSAVRFVVEKLGVHVDVRNNDEQTPLLDACLSGQVEVVKYLCERKADVSVVDVEGASALHCAAYSGNVSTVKFVVEELGVHVDVRSNNQRTPLLSACLFGQVEVVKYLCERKADVSVVDVRGNSALHCAARSGNVSTVKFVVEELGVHVDVRNNDQWTPLLSACWKGQVEVVKYLCERKADVSVVDVNGASALHWAAYSGNVSTVKFVVEELGVHVDVKINDEGTPLLYACLSGQVEVVEYLCERKADVSLVDVDGASALHYAAVSGNVSTVKFVVEELGVLVDVRSKNQLTPLLYACSKGQVEVVKYLCERKADVSVVDVRGDSALHFAAVSGNVSTVKFVVEELGVNVDVDVRNNDQWTPLLSACLSGQVEVVKYLCKRKADVSVVDVEGDSALHCAALSGNVSTVKFVVEELGVHVDVRNNDQQTPLLYACLSGQVEVVKYLCERKADVSVVGVRGNSALHCAALIGSVSAVRFVVEELGVNVDVDVRNNDQQTPLLYACAFGQVEVVKYLCERKADVSVVDVRGNSPLHMAVGSGNVSTVKFVVEELGMKVDLMNRAGQTPMSIARQKAHEAVVTFLTAEAGRQGEGQRPSLHASSLSNDVDTVQRPAEEPRPAQEERRRRRKSCLLL